MSEDLLEPEQSDLENEKFHRLDTLDKKTKTIIGLITLVIIFVALPLLSLPYYKFAVNRPSQNSDEETVTIKSGQGASEIASQLFADDVINSEFLFKFYVVVNRLQNNIQAGIYTIPAGTSIADLADILQYGTNDKTITFLEGWRVEEYAKEASEMFEKIDYAEFLKLAKNQEGYLFPDTYEFSSEVTEQEMINRLKNNFTEKTDVLITQEALDKVKMTKEQVVIFASIVEREIRNEDDRPVVAGILIKRWQEGIKLDADATTQYSIAAQRYGCEAETNENLQKICPDEEQIPNVSWWPEDLTEKELESESPFNTRSVLGLPPSPIASPSISAINAVLNSETTVFYFYLNDAEGTTHFAETNDGHNKNIAKFLSN